MFGVQNRIIGIKETGQTATVPNSSMACLMYYLGCVKSLTDFNIPQKLTNYHNYQGLSFDDENLVLSYTNLLNPSLFILKGIMINDPSLCKNKSNKFYSITNSRLAFSFTRSFTIANQNVHTLKIMAFKTNWLEKNYTNPMKFYSLRISAIKNNTVERLRPRRAFNPYFLDDSQYSIKSNNDIQSCNIY